MVGDAQERQEDNVKTLFAITHVETKTGFRRLTLGNQGRNHEAIRAEAERKLEALQGPSGLSRILTPTEYQTLRVDPVECYDHGDATGIYINEKGA